MRKEHNYTNVATNLFIKITVNLLYGHANIFHKINRLANLQNLFSSKQI